MVERFFTQNFRDITSRKTFRWSKPEKQENGNVALVYRYETVIWDKDIIVDERRFVFNKRDEFVSCGRTEDFPQTTKQ